MWSFSKHVLRHDQSRKAVRESVDTGAVVASSVCVGPHNVKAGVDMRYSQSLAGSASKIR
jgi:hypothetical protein